MAARRETSRRVGPRSLVIAYLDHKWQAEAVITLAKTRYRTCICFVGTRGEWSVLCP